MSRRRIIVATFTVLLAAVLVALFRLPDVVGYILEYKLRDAGFSDVSINIESITPTQSRINAIHMSHPAVRIEASALQLEYSLSQLLHGEIETISLETLQLIPALPAHRQTMLFVPPALPDDWLASVPFHSVQLEHVTVTLPHAVQGIETIALQVRALRKPEQLQLDASLAARDRPPLYLKVNADHTNALRVAIQEGTEATPFLALDSHSLSMTRDRLSAKVSTRADLATLRALSRQWLPQQTLPVIFDAFTIEGSIEYTAVDDRLQADIDVMLSGARHKARGPVSLAYQAGQLGIVLKESFSIRAQQQVIAEVSVPDVQLFVKDDINCAYLVTRASWQCGPARVQLALPEVLYPPYGVYSKGGMIKLQRLAGDKQGWHGGAELDLTDIDIALPDNTLRLDSVHTQLQATPDEIKAATNVHAADGKLAMAIVASHDLRQQRGKADIELQPVSLDAAHNIPGKLLQRWPFPVSFTDGMVNGLAELRWQDTGNGKLRIMQHSALKLEDVNGYYQQFPFKGLAGNMVLQGTDSLVVTSPNGIRLAEFNPGVAINDTHIQGTISREPNQKPVFRLRSFVADLLGGRVSTQDTVLDLNRAESPFTLHVEGLDLTALLKIEHEEGLYGTGTLDGSLPLVLGKDGLRMEAGRLSARPPGGVIRYTGDERVTALAKSNANVELLLKA
ncbi:MAG: YdbH domain-containing protein, partial [Granulosicoccaceae bacterium]